MTEEAKDKALVEIKRLEGMPPMSAEAGVSRNYVDWLLAVPWKNASREIRDIARREGAQRGPLRPGEGQGPDPRVPGRAAAGPEDQRHDPLLRRPARVSARPRSASSIARATGRKFVRLSLGGVRDEAEIRGHRRTYIGAFPGQIIQMMRKAGTVNPVILLDEVDKMAADFRGDPASALLEVLDPEQNHTFHDHYLDVEYDLSKVFFICTANVTHTIPPALLDRMEAIRLSGYTHREKLEIARQFLVPRQVEKQGLDRVQGRVQRREPALPHRALHPRGGGAQPRARDRLDLPQARAAGAQGARLAAGADAPGRPRAGRASSSASPATARTSSTRSRRWVPRPASPGPRSAASSSPPRWALMRGKGGITLTGQLGDVMQESARAALSFVRSRGEHLGIDAEVFEKTDVHVHVPEGAIPKDGPSAGITMATALVSAFAGIPVRADLAMTGEITLRGKVLPVGGIKEKILAAYRAGIREVILPEENERTWRRSRRTCVRR